METVIVAVFLFILSLVLYGINDLINIDKTLKSQIQMMGIVNLILVCIFAYLSSLYIQASTTFPTSYFFILIGLTIFISIMSVGRSSLSLSDLSPTTGYWLDVFFPFILVLIGFSFYILFFLPDIQFISEDSFYKTIRLLNKNKL
jgi:hypothetical protein